MRQDGYNLVEMILVLAVVGILASVAVMSFTGWRNSSLVSQGVADVTRAVGTARGESKKVNATRSVTFTSGGTSYTLNGQSFSLPRGARIVSVAAEPTSLVSGGAVTLTFNPPYGTLEGVQSVTLNVGIVGQTTPQRALRIVGVTGKAVLQ